MIIEKSYHSIWKLGGVFISKNLSKWNAAASSLTVYQSHNLPPVKIAVGLMMIGFQIIFYTQYLTAQKPFILWWWGGVSKGLAKFPHWKKFH